MKYLITLILTLAVSQTYGQISNLQTLQGQIIKEDDVKALAEGTPYLIDEFTEGYLTYPEKDYKGVFIRYNLFSKQFEVQRESGEVIELRMNNILKLGFDRKRPGVYGVEMLTIDNTWYQVLIPKRLYKSYNTTIVEDAQPGYNTAERRKRFVTQVRYFVADSKLTLTEVDMKKKDLLPIMKKQNESSKYAKSNRLKFTREEDVIKILTFDNN